MLTKNNFNEDTISKIKKFISGDMNITNFMLYCEENNEIYDYLQWIIDCITAHDIPIKRRRVSMKNVNQNQPFDLRSYAEDFIKKYAKEFNNLSPEWKERPPKVKDCLESISHLTAYGACHIHDIVADIYYQVEPDLKKLIIMRTSINSL